MRQFTTKEALQRAKMFGLEEEVTMAMKSGCSPNEALEDWDIYPFDEP